MGCDIQEIHSVFSFIIYLISALSIIGSFLIIVSYLIIVDLRTHICKLILNISICQFLNVIQFLLPLSVYSNKNFCEISAIIFNTSEFLSIMWTACIVITLYQVLIHNSDTFVKKSKTILITGWILTPLVNILPLFTSSFNIVGGSCTFTQDLTGNIWRFALFFFPAWCFVLFTFWTYAKLFFQIKRMGVTQENEAVIERIKFYPGVLLVALIPLTVLRGMYSYNATCGYFVFELITEMTFAVQGFINAVVFFRTPSVSVCIKACFQKKKENYTKKSISNRVTNVKGSINLLDLEE